MKVTPGLYQLRIHLKRPRTIRLGALGRHLRHRKQKHWHIDYLLAVADQVEAFVLPGETLTECELHARLRDGKALVSGFGASDCRCESHLAWFKKRPGIRLTPWQRFIRDCLLYCKD